MKEGGDIWFKYLVGQGTTTRVYSDLGLEVQLRTQPGCAAPSLLLYKLGLIPSTVVAPPTVKFEPRVQYTLGWVVVYTTTAVIALCCRKRGLANWTRLVQHRVPGCLEHEVAYDICMRTVGRLPSFSPRTAPTPLGSTQRALSTHSVLVSWVQQNQKISMLSTYPNRSRGPLLAYALVNQVPRTRTRVRLHSVREPRL